MIWPFKKKSGPSDEVFAIYNGIVAQSRRPIYYSDWAIPDSVTGRFDMISVHLCLVFRRLRPATGAGNPFAQDLFDLFFKDMDLSLREMGVNDVSIPKRIQKMGNVFYGLLSKMTEAIDANDPKGLSEILDRNLYEGEKEPSAKVLAAYILDSANWLEDQQTETITAGELTWREVS